MSRANNPKTIRKNGIAPVKTSSTNRRGLGFAGEPVSTRDQQILARQARQARHQKTLKEDYLKQTQRSNAKLNQKPRFVTTLSLI